MIAETRLETERLTLRSLHLNDARRIQELAGAREVAATTLNIPHPYPLQSAIDFINYTRHTMRNGEAYTFAITHKPHNALIGCIGLNLTPEYHRAELGYWVGVPYWGKGYTTEAAHTVLKFGFETLNLNRIYAAYFATNSASGRVMQKIGMTYEGTLRQHLIRWGEYHDSCCYGILRAEYEQRCQEDKP